jgi:glycosyltransferase involved in cell wall biosynthesis
MKKKVMSQNTQSLIPKISVIIPVYGEEKYLYRCLNSVILQSLYEIEIIIATDGPEACNNVCEEYTIRDSRIKLIRYPGSYGRAVNRGIKLAQGSYIGIVEADDWLDLFMYEKLYNMAINYDADLCKSAFYISYDSNLRNKTVYTDIKSGYFLLKNYPQILCYQPSVWSAIYKRTFLMNNNIYFMEEKLSFVDVPFHLQTMLKAKNIAFVNEPLYYYYQDNPNQSIYSSKNILDGLRTEEYFHTHYAQEYTEDEQIFEILILTAIKHIKWNYDRLRLSCDKRQFWLEAHSFVRRHHFKLKNFIEFSHREKYFYLLLYISPYYFPFDILYYCYKLGRLYKKYFINLCNYIL